MLEYPRAWVIAIGFGVPILLAGLLTIARRNRRPGDYADTIENKEAADQMGVTPRAPDVPVP